MSSLQKRKRSSIHATPKKRARLKESPEPEPEDQGNDDYWAAKSILDEKPGRYLIDWEPHHTTGEIYEPTWEPKANANLLLVKDWKQKKASKAAAASPKQTPKARQRPRTSRVVAGSSSAFSTPSKTQALDTPASSVTSSLRRSSRLRESPSIQVGPREHFNPTEFEAFSQLPATVASAGTQERSSAQEDDEAADDTARSQPSSKSIVPDTESSQGSATFVPATQNDSIPGTSNTNTGTETQSSYIETPQEDSHSSGETSTQGTSSEQPYIPSSNFLDDPIETSSQPGPQPGPQSGTEEANESTSALGSHSLDQEDEGIEIPESPEQRNLDSLGQASTPKSVAAEGESTVPSELDGHSNSSSHRVEEEPPEPQIPETISSPPSEQLAATSDNNLSAAETSIVQESSTRHSLPVTDLDEPATDSVVAISPASIVENTPSFGEPAAVVTGTTATHTSGLSELVDGITEKDADIQHSGSPKSVAPEELATSRLGSPNTSERIAVTPPILNTEVDTLVLDPIVRRDRVTKENPQGEAEQQDIEGNSPQDSGASIIAGFLTSLTGSSGASSASESSDEPQIVQKQREIEGSAESNESSETDSQSQNSSESFQVQEQHAQIVEHDLYKLTQEYSLGSIRPTTEIDPVVLTQVNIGIPKRITRPAESSPGQPEDSLALSSPLPKPPSNSLPSLIHSVPPPRPKSPVISSSASVKMTDLDDNEIRQAFERALPSSTPHPPFKSKKPILMSSALAASPGGAGTRSPSTIPDRSPGQQPPSLRTSALMNSTAIQQPEAPPIISPPALPNISHGDEDVDIPDAEVDESAASDGAEIDVDDEDEEESLLQDDLDISDDRYFVPLIMDGKQKSSYQQQVQKNYPILKEFVLRPDNVSNLEPLQTLEKTLGNLETHPDLLFAESSIQSVADVVNARWSYENSIKFRFVGALISELQRTQSRIVIVLEKDDESTFGLLETFLKGRTVNYEYPAKNHAATVLDDQSPLLVTLLSVDSKDIIRPATVILTFDNIDPDLIRSKDWAKDAGRTIPILQLVIPRTVDHIRRCLSSSLSEKERLHTIFAALAQVEAEIGQALQGSPRAVGAAQSVAEWLISLRANEDFEKLEWPLPPLHSIKDVIDHTSLTKSTQASQGPQSHDHTPTPASSSNQLQAASSKRPLDAEDLDPAKRVRMTPQPQHHNQVDKTPNASGNVDAEVTHISDSLPGTAVDASRLQEQRHRSELRELEQVWAQRQTDYEDLSKRFRLLLGEQKHDKDKIENLTKSRESLKEQLDKLRTEITELRQRLEEQREINLASDNENKVALTRLRIEADEANKLKEEAQRKKELSDKMVEYMKDQLRDSQEAAASWKAQYDEKEAELQNLQARSPTRVTGIRNEHQNNVVENMTKQIAKLRGEIRVHVQVMNQKEEEIQKLKNGRGYGTRGGSVPRLGAGSRAASPLARDRLSNLRNANG